MLSFLLERKVVCTTFSLCFSYWRERSCGGSCGGYRRLLRREGCGGLRLSLATNDIVGSDIVEPASVEFMGINVKLHGKVFTVLDVELANAVFAKKTEHATAGELSRHLNDIVLRHPVVTRALRNATLCWYYSNDFSC